jgi:hypothetical protein
LTELVENVVLSHFAAHENGDAVEIVSFFVLKLPRLRDRTDPAGKLKAYFLRFCIENPRPVFGLGSGTSC